MSDDRHEELLRKDWADDWETLPEAPPLVHRSRVRRLLWKRNVSWTEILVLLSLCVLVLAFIMLAGR